MRCVPLKAMRVSSKFLPQSQESNDPRVTVYPPAWAPLRTLSLVAVVAACGHNDSFTSPPYGTDAPFDPAPPVRLTLNPLPDLNAAWLPDGSGILYSTRPAERLDNDLCLALLPPTGGRQLRVTCDLSVGGIDSTNRISSPAPSSAGRLAFVESSGPIGASAALTEGIAISSSLDAPGAEIVQRIPYTIAGEPTHNHVGSLRWLGTGRLVFVGGDLANLADCAGCPATDIVADLKIVTLAAAAGARPEVVPGTDFASSVSAGKSADEIYYTIGGDSRVFRRTLSTGEVTVAFDFGAAGIARDVHVVGNRMAAVVGGRVVFGINPVLGPTQRDSGGVVHVVDLAAGSDQSLDDPGLLFRRPALDSNGEHLRGRGISPRDLRQRDNGGHDREQQRRPLSLRCPMNAVIRRISSVAALLLLGLSASRRAQAQAEGAVAGRVRDTKESRSLGNAQVLLDDVVAAVTDTSGRYRIRAVRTGWHRVAARLIGYRGVVLDSVFVRAGATIGADFALEPSPIELEPLVVTAPVDELLDPLATASEQKITAADLRNLPVSPLEEAVALSAGSVGTSYRGGRMARSPSFSTASASRTSSTPPSGGLGLSTPAGFPRRGIAGHQRLLGEVRPGPLRACQRRHSGSRRAWEGRAALRDRPPAGRVWIDGLDRLVARRAVPSRAASGSLRPSGRLRTAGRRSGQRAGAGEHPRSPALRRLTRSAAQQRRAMGRRGQAGRAAHVAGDGARARLHSENQRLLFDPVYKYDPDFAPASRLRGDMLSGHVQYKADPVRASRSSWTPAPADSFASSSAAP